MTRFQLALTRLGKLIRLCVPGIRQGAYIRQIRRSGTFDREFYIRAHPGLNPVFRLAPLRHYVLWGEAVGLQPNRAFSPQAYLNLNPDVASAGLPPLGHYLSTGRHEGRPLRNMPVESLPECATRPLRFDPSRVKAPYAIHLHIFYPDLWPEFRDRLRTIDIAADLFITLTWRGRETARLAEKIEGEFPDAYIHAMPNRGRDILPFVRLVNAGAFEGYDAVCKIHTKKSPHRTDGVTWRRHLVDGILPGTGTAQRLSRFVEDRDAAMLVADGQSYDLDRWWGSNKAKTEAMLRRVEIDLPRDTALFPAGSIYWLKPLMIGMIRGLRLTEDLFEVEQGQIDGTLAHAFERGIGVLASAAGQKVREVSALSRDYRPAPPAPRYVSAFYLPQFHPTPENDAWWGAGFSEWRGVAAATSAFPGHLQPMRPGALGYYDLRSPDVMQDQARLARQAGVDAFCVYHYAFGTQRLLHKPMDQLMARPDIDFPFYLCWANESWRRNWDGLSGDVLIEQDYSPGFEQRLVESTLPYMRDPRYQRPDGRRPRFVIYRPEDMPAPMQNVARMRRAWREAGIGPVELGAVCFHVSGRSSVAEDLFDFWVEMPPHGVVAPTSYVHGGPAGSTLHPPPAHDFGGLIYDYSSVANHALSQRYRKTLPDRTIAGIMPSWDNTARRGAQAHIARGGTPAAFRYWLTRLCEGPLQQSYRGELFVNAWNEWAEKAMLEPTEVFGHCNLDVLAEATGSRRRGQAEQRQDHA
ncbi:glycoside hydrolase family 99-like domain-containing protein [Pseudooceanicola onchidii]|uniref:glycoside hydrolase family 99-like domain-containing protein n=1 Tax=Pseudooceanicola onchidii TaxID=2562279 RepID=UPI0010A9F9C3|nr:glycoside hydrolase family 99-like domain-containing protein [Pseudooceanicola onchidii]